MTVIETEHRPRFMFGSMHE